MCWACAGLLSLALILGPVLKALLTFPAVMLAAFFVTYPTGRFPGISSRYHVFNFGANANIVTSLLLLVAGAFVALSLSAQESSLLNAPLDVVSQMTVALCCFFAGFVVRFRIHGFMARLYYSFQTGSAPKTGGIKFPLWIPVASLYCCTLMAAIGLVIFSYAHATIYCILTVISAGFLVCVMYLIVRLKYSYLIVEKATNKAGKLIVRLRP